MSPDARLGPFIARYYVGDCCYFFATVQESAGSTLRPVFGAIHRPSVIIDGRTEEKHLKRPSCQTVLESFTTTARTSVWHKITTRLASYSVERGLNPDDTNSKPPERGTYIPLGLN